MMSPIDLTMKPGDARLSARFRDAITQELEAQGIKAADLARSAGLAESHVSRILSGEYNPRAATLAKIAEALGRSWVLQ